MAIGEDFEARGFGQAEGDACGRVIQLDVFFWRSGEAHVDAAVAVVDFHFAARIFDGDVIRIGAQRKISRRIRDFEIAGAGFHVAGKLSERQVRSLRDEADAFGDFIGADRSVEFTVDRKPAAGSGNVHFAAVAGKLDVAVGVRNFDVAFARVDGDVSGGAANFNVADPAAYVDGLGHVDDGDVSSFVADGECGLLRNSHVQIQAHARIPGTNSRWMHLVPVAILHDFDGGAIGDALSITLAPGLGILLARDTNLRLARGAHADVASTVSNRDAGVRGNSLGWDVQVEADFLTTPIVRNVSRKMLPAVINGDHKAEEREKSKKKKNLA